MNDKDRSIADSLADLRVQAAALVADPELAALLRRHCPDLFAAGGGRGPNLRIHPEDPMLLHSLRHHRDANAAVSQYFNVALQQYRAARQIIEICFPPAAGPIAVLDFACGFGRLVRFLSSSDRRPRLWASDIQNDALHFVGAAFDVMTLPSSADPENFDPGRRFDVIWVASLFSHLPSGLFKRWLDRLLALLQPDGVLCFSVHDETLLPPGERLPASGLLFKPQSEDAELDTQIYGTSYVDEAFVRAAIEGAMTPGHPYHRIRKALAHEQDVYVVAADRGRDLSGLAGFRRGAWGWVDERRVEGQRLMLSGWAASIEDGTLPSVLVRVDDREFVCPTGQARPDVVDAFADPRMRTAGWSAQIELAAADSRPWVEVTATSDRGEVAWLYAGWPAGRPFAPVDGGQLYR